jgi:hypothetical protein
MIAMVITLIIAAFIGIDYIEQGKLSKWLFKSFRKLQGKADKDKS